MKKMKSGQFGLNEYLSQLRSINKMGGLGKIMGMMPGMGNMMGKVDPSKMDGKVISHQEAIILSMTAKERRTPDLLNASRRKRIASGSGTSVQEVNKLIKQFMQIRDMMKKMSKMSPMALMKGGIGKLFGG